MLAAIEADRPSAENTSWIEAEDAECFLAVNERPFTFRHKLQQSPVFTLENLIALGERLPDGPAFKSWQNGKVGAAEGWDARPVEPLSFHRTIEGIAENDSVLIMKHVEQDRVFGPILRDLLQEVFSYAPRAFRDDVVIGECLIFLNSPHRTTPYHFDLEPSFLLQVQGEKLVHAWPCGDRNIVPQRELEDYCGAGNLSAAIYKPERQADAFTTKLLPGDGIHFPSTGPHLVLNGDAVSISVNINFDMRSLHHRMKYAYAVNRRLRKIGLQPTDPGLSPLADSMKAGVWTLGRNAKRLARNAIGRTRNGETYPVWRPRR